MAYLTALARSSSSTARNCATTSGFVRYACAPCWSTRLTWLGVAALVSHLDVGREHERLHAQTKRVPQHGHPAHQGDFLNDAAVQVLRQWLGGDHDRLVRGAHGNCHERSTAHHHALEDSLAAVRDFGRT